MRTVLAAVFVYRHLRLSTSGVDLIHVRAPATQTLALCMQEFGF
jgi:hypothetical protein